MVERHYEDGPTWLFRGLAILLVFVGLAIFVSAVLNTVLSPGSITMPFMTFSFGWSFIWNIIGLLFAIWILLWIFRAISHPHRHWHYPYGDEKEIARRRYANGEINRKEYMEIVKDLESTKD